MKTKALLGVALLTVGTMSAVVMSQSIKPISTNFQVQAQSLPYTAQFYARTSVEGVEKYLTYNGSTTMTITEDVSEALFDITFNSTTEVTIARKVSNELTYDLGYAGSGTDLKNQSKTWSLELLNSETGCVHFTDGIKERTLAFRGRDAKGSWYNTAKAYAQVEDQEYFQVYFYKAEDYNNRVGICNWSADQITCLTNLIYPLDKHEFVAPTRYNVSFNANGGSGSMAAIGVIDGTSIDKPTCAFTAPNGYEFDTWYVGGSAASFPLTITEDTELVAHYVQSVSIKSPFTIDSSFFNSTSYAANNNDHVSLKNPIHFTSYQVMKKSDGDVMQWQKSKGYIYNTTSLGTITDITVNSTAGTFTIYYGTTENPTSGDKGSGKGFFRIQVGSATGYVTSIVITFTA